MTVQVQIALRPCVVAVDPAPVGCWWRVLERLVRAWTESAGGEQDVITTRLDVGKTSPLR